MFQNLVSVKIGGVPGAWEGVCFLFHGTWYYSTQFIVFSALSWETIALSRSQDPGWLQKDLWWNKAVESRGRSCEITTPVAYFHVLVNATGWWNPRGRLPICADFFYRT